MKIEHIAIWVRDLEKSRHFYETYFKMKSGNKYTNTTKQFTSYFLSFEGADTRLEIMHRPDISEGSKDQATLFGLTHIAISVGSKEQVDYLTEKLRADGYSVVGAPRTTGDGYYESVVLDNDGNHVEITI